jgi:hypothetical protein
MSNYKGSVYVAANSTATFDPPINGISILGTAPTSVNVTINGVENTLDLSSLTYNGSNHVILPNCTAIAAADGFNYIALRGQGFPPKAINDTFTGGDSPESPGPSVTVTGLIDTLTANIMTDVDPTSEELGSLTGIQIRSDFGIGFLFSSEAARDSFVASYNSGTWALTIGGATTTAAITAAEDFNTALATTRAYLVPAKFPSWEESMSYPYDTNYGSEEPYTITFT